MNCPARWFQMQGQLCFTEVQELLQKAWHMTCSIIIAQPSEQWTSRSKHKILKRTMEEFYETNAGIHVSVLQIRYTLGPDYPAWPCSCLTHHQDAYCQDLAVQP